MQRRRIARLALSRSRTCQRRLADATFAVDEDLATWCHQRPPYPFQLIITPKQELVGLDRR